ncbi:3-carboxy-cis,cis-muconate cycloisomerase [Jatrophihabitans endophyticus]|uniref:3-carboxy-cis,cis-muconate cycloisomerase n=1 Tax=Jatrophihabitans endophyticus TaxID=1206085 RepID=A0A1M5EDF1_9ACTN|nr:lyase family protein [Jatrophihabitans endophyticus]SHF77269.1 3-carboxy-cis,cis-muconate cycloisomerase [Jatrophihabitans endophyticus]
MTSALFDPIFGRTAVDAAVDDRAWLAALCEVETALARACARVGVIELATALEIGAAADALAGGDPGVLGAQAVAGGNPVIPLVTSLRDAVRRRAGDGAAAAVHLGATSQDVLDTAAMLVSSRAAGVIGADLADCANRAAELARIHRDTPMTGRTLLQHAVPTTFGALAAVWGAGLDHAGMRLARVRDDLPAQLGGAAGTLAPLHPRGQDVVGALADELDLRAPTGVWHGERGPVVELAGALGGAAVAIGKAAGDVVLLAQTELGEVQEAAPGGSSAMAHKRNPIAAVTARAGAIEAPGHVAALLTAAMPELQRGAGTWHAEWTPLVALLRCVGGAASRLRTSLTGLSVDHGAMLRNIGDDVLDLGHAGDLVDRYLKGRA